MSTETGPCLVQQACHTVLPMPLAGLNDLVRDMRATALDALRRMYRPAERVFAFRLRREDGRDVLEGVSRRYTAMTLLGLAGEPEAAARKALHGHTREEVCEALIAEASRGGSAAQSASPDHGRRGAPRENLGDTAVIAWAARVLGIAEADAAWARVLELAPAIATHPTVELAWALAAAAARDDGLAESNDARRIARRLLDAHCERTGLFSHGPADAPRTMRSHVSCFADLVYPTQALAMYAAAAGDGDALAAAGRCAEAMCRGQGADGQWWWHFDVRTGRVIEGYPVYAVHQDAMAPMALFAAAEACGTNHDESVARGLSWLAASPELDGGSLIDRDAGVIWRKVGRREPGKLSRALQAAASAVHPRLRAPGLGAVLRPGRIDYETRPYHMGWVLYAWPERRSEVVSGSE